MEMMQFANREFQLIVYEIKLHEKRKKKSTGASSGWTGCIVYDILFMFIVTLSKRNKLLKSNKSCFSSLIFLLRSINLFGLVPCRCVLPRLDAWIIRHTWVYMDDANRSDYMVRKSDPIFQLESVNFSNWELTIISESNTFLHNFDSRLFLPIFTQDCRLGHSKTKHFSYKWKCKTRKSSSCLAVPFSRFVQNHFLQRCFLQLLAVSFNSRIFSCIFMESRYTRGMPLKNK